MRIHSRDPRTASDSRPGRILIIALLAGIIAFGGWLAPGSADAQIYKVTTCSDCHSYPPVDAPATRGTPSGAVIGSHGEHSITYGYACTVCHINNGTNEAHRDGNIDMIANIQGGSYSLGSVTQRNILTGAALGTCSNVACHTNGVTTATVYQTPKWGTASTGACGTCHGVTASALPTSALHGQHSGTTAGYKFSCSKCHNTVVGITTDATVTSAISSTSLHVNFVKNVAFDTTNTGADAYASKGAQTCSNLYCHSQGSKSTTPYSTPNTTATWITTLTCEGCHDFDKNATNKMHSGSHTAHVVTSSYGCQLCHSLTTLNGSTITAATATFHVNKLVNIDFDALNPAGTYGGSTSTAKTPGTAFLQCATTYCHGSGTPTWSTSNGTLNCASCHNATNALAGKHAMHYGTTTTAQNITASSNPTGTFYIFNCGVCHPNGTHATGPVTTRQSANITFDATIAGGGVYTAAGISAGVDRGFNWTAGTCSMYCHSAGTSASSPYATPSVTNFNWNTTSLDCAGCHGGAVGTVKLMSTNAHSSHINDGAKNKIGRSFQCHECHSATASTTTDFQLSSATYHVNKQVNLKFDGTGTLNKDTDNPAYQGVLTTVAGGAAVTTGVGSNQCSNVYCHSLGNLSGTNPATNTVIAAGTYSFSTPTWGGSALQCDSCHGDKAGKAWPVYASGGSGTENSHRKHVESANQNCSYCHAGTTVSTVTTAGTMTIVPGGKHLNRVEDVIFVTNGSKTGNYNPTAKNCSNTYCHGTSASPAWGTTGPLSCGTCHVANNSLPGKHAMHYGSSNTALDASAASNPTGTFYIFNCGVCHNNTPHATGPASTIQTANISFDATIAGGGVYTAAGISAGTDSDGYNWTAGSCSMYCHSAGTSATSPYATPSVTNFNWNTASLDCAGCHGGAVGTVKLMSTNAHSSHINDGAKNKIGRSFQCRECHNATASSTTDFATTSAQYHVDKRVNIMFNDAGINKNADNPAYQGVTTSVAGGASVTTGVGSNQCSNVYCHSLGNLNGTNPATNTVIGAGTYSFATPTWGGTALTCDSCHGDKAGKAWPVYASGSAGSTTANSHGKHVESANQNCSYCHVGTTVSTATTAATMTVVPTSAGGRHLNRIEDVVFATNGSKTGNYNPTAKNCSNTYCHGTSASPAWGTTGPLSCGTCHVANNSLPGKHAMHYGSSNTALDASAASNPTGTFYVFNCGVCHNNTPHATGPASTIQTANISFDATIAGGGVYTAAGISAGTDSDGFNWTAGTCSMYCHSAGTSASSPYATPSVTNFNWNTASLDCAGCHGGAVGTVKLMSTNAHSSHINDGAKNKIGRSLPCRECHNATASSTTDFQLSSATYHVNRQVNLKFDSTGTLNRNTDNPFYQGVSTTGVSGASVTTGLGSNQCSNVYCHSLGNSDFTTKNVISVGAYSFATPTWGGTSLQCDSCHGDKAGKAYPVYVSGGSGTENSHVAHVATNGYTCNLCHVATTVSTTITAATMTIVPGGSHLNRVEDVVFASYWTKTGAYNGANKTCSSTYCHGSGVPQWGNAAAITCGSCHLGAADTTDFTYNNGSFAVISQMEWTTSGHGRSTANGPYSATNNTAANLPTAVGTGDPCLYCHDDAVGHQNTPNFFRLRSFASGTNANQVCWNCHGTLSVGVNPKSGTSATVNGITKVDKYHYGDRHASTLNGGQFCWDCHEPHGDRAAGATGPIAMIQSRPTMSSDPTTGKPVTIVSTTVTFTSIGTANSYATWTFPLVSPSSFGNLCNACHTNNPAGQQKMVHYNTSTSDKHNSDKNCMSCHKHSGDSVKDGDAFAGGGCQGCHSSAGGPTPGSTPDAYHAMHGVIALPDNATYGTTSWYVFSHTGGTPQMGCGMCHPQTNPLHTSGTVTPVTGVALNFRPTDTNAVFPKTYNGNTTTVVQTPGVTVTCSSVYCHSNGYSPSANAANRDVAYTTTPNWYGGAGQWTDNCAGCHQNSPTGTSAHGEHVIGLHTSATGSGSEYNGTRGLMRVGTGNSGTVNHGNANTATTVNCNICHNATVSTSSNDKNTKCSSCHNGTAISKSYATIATTAVTHINGTIDVVFINGAIRTRTQVRDNITTVPDLNRNWTRSGTYKQSGSYDQSVNLQSTAVWDPANRTCSNMACHNASSTTDSVRWRQPATVTCDTCHSTLP